MHTDSQGWKNMRTVWLCISSPWTGVLQHCKVLPSILWTTNGLFFAFWYRWCLFLNLNLQNCLPDMYNDYLLIGSKGRFCWTSYYSIWFSILESMDSLFTGNVSNNLDFFCPVHGVTGFESCRVHVTYLSFFLTFSCPENLI